MPESPTPRGTPRRASNPTSAAALAAFAISLSGCTPGPPQIHDLQGDGARSPWDGATVAVEGVVTAASERGFFVECAAPDRRDATSEGLYVEGSGATTGDLVLLRGVVREQAGQSNELSVTTLVLAEPTGGAAPLEVLAAGHSLPPPAPAPGPVADIPRTIARWETVEGMRVRFDEAIVVGPTNRYGEAAIVLGDRLPDGALVTTRGGVLDSGAGRTAPILLDDELSRQPELAVGDRIRGPVTAIVHYRFGAYRLYPLEPVFREPGGLEPEHAEPAADGAWSVATLNVENLDLGDAPSHFAGLATLIVEHLGSPDLIALQEVQDDSGPADDGVVASDATHARLIEAIRAAGGPRYAFRDARPEDGADGGAPGGNIRVSFLIQRHDEQQLVDRTSSASPDAVGVAAAAAAQISHSNSRPRLVPSPGRLGVGDEAFNGSRKPLVAELWVGRHQLFVINVHLSSKRGDDPLLGLHQPPRRPTDARRLAQAAVIGRFLDELRAAAPAALVLVLGDFNDTVGSPALAELEAHGLLDLMRELPEDDRYTFVYRGRSAALDHVLASRSLIERFTPTIDVVHANAELPASGRVTDHDPVLVRFAGLRSP